MLRKLSLAVIVLILSSGLIYGTGCYTSAEVRSDAAIKIVNSENALIAIKQTRVLDDTSKIADENHVILTVKNNMNTTIKVFGVSSGIRLYNRDEENNNNCFNLAPGRETSYKVRTCVDKKNCIDNIIKNAQNYNKDMDPCIHDIVFHGIWDGGEAAINYSIKP